MENTADLQLDLSPAAKLRLGVYGRENLFTSPGADVETEKRPPKWDDVYYVGLQRIRYAQAEAVPINEVLIPSNEPIDILLSGKQKFISK
jgi:hypothetical protein